MTHKADSQYEPGKITAEEVMRITGPIEAERIAMILALEPTPEELAEAVAWAADEEEAIGEIGHPLSGRIEKLYDILTADEIAFEEQP